jgi:hypothetical protein
VELLHPSFITCSGLDIYTASDHLPRYLLDPKKGASYKVDETPFQEALGTSKTWWDWLEEKIPAGEHRSGNASYPGYFDSTISTVNERESVISRPELDIFGLAMVAVGRVSGTSHVYGITNHFVGHIEAGIRLIIHRLSLGLTRRCCSR